MDDAISVAVQTDVPWSRVADLLCTGIEGGYSPWLHAFTLQRGKPTERPWYCDGAMLASGAFQILASYDRPDQDEGEGHGRALLSQANLVAALRLMAQKYPRHFQDFIVENDDAETGDTFLQLLVLGDVVYG